MAADRHDLPRRLAALGVPPYVAEAAGEIHRLFRPDLSFEHRKNTPAMPRDERIPGAPADPLRLWIARTEKRAAASTTDLPRALLRALERLDGLEPQEATRLLHPAPAPTSPPRLSSVTRTTQTGSPPSTDGSTARPPTAAPSFLPLCAPGASASDRSDPAAAGSPPGSTAFPRSTCAPARASPRRRTAGMPGWPPPPSSAPLGTKPACHEGSGTPRWPPCCPPTDAARWPSSSTAISISTSADRSETQQSANPDPPSADRPAPDIDRKRGRRGGRLPTPRSVRE